MSRKVVYNARYGGFGISEAGVEYLKEKGLTEDQIDDLQYERHNPLLVQMVEELGKEASSRFAALNIQVVSGQYMIDEHDGYETVVEPHHLHWQ